MTVYRHILGAFLALLIPITQVSAQTQEQLAQMDPSDLIYNGWNISRKAEKLIEKKEYVDAYAKFRQAKAIYDTMAINYPSYKPDIVKMRQDLTRKRMDTVYPKAEAEQKEQQKESGNFIEGAGLGKNLVVPIDPIRDQKRTQNLQNLQGQIEQLKRSLANAMNDRDANAAKARRALADLQTERDRLASAPLRSEVEALNAEIIGLKHERDTLSLTLAQTRQRLEIAREALNTSRKEALELKAVIREQGKINSRVVKGQQDQIDELRSQLKQKDLTIANANQRIDQLAAQLEQSQGMVAELQDEREDLIREKQELASYLELKEADRIPAILAQNVALNRKFNDAKKKLDTVLANEDATSEKLTLAKRGVTVAKAKIRETQRENAQQKLRIRDLENRLELAEQDISMSAKNDDLTEVQREELTMLREIAKSKRNQLMAQQKKAELLIAQAERMGLQDPAWAQAVNQFKGSITPELTPDEEAMIADISLKSRYKPSDTERIRANQELQRQTDDKKKLAARFYEKDNLEAARGILEMVIEDNPASWDSMINLGIVNLRLNDFPLAAKQFENAILYAGDRKIPIAHFLLGDAHYRSDRFAEAETEINRSLGMDSENAQAHVLLGNMAGKSGRIMDAEAHFKRAIEIDPNIWEPHYNLAFICSQNDRKTHGKIHYQEALRRGAPANLELEKKLGL